MTMAGPGPAHRSEFVLGAARSDPRTQPGQRALSAAAENCLAACNSVADGAGGGWPSAPRPKPVSLRAQCSRRSQREVALCTTAETGLVRAQCGGASGRLPSLPRLNTVSLRAQCSRRSRRRMRLSAAVRLHVRCSRRSQRQIGTVD